MTKKQPARTRGTIAQKGNRYYPVVRQDGKRKWGPGYGTKKEAEVALTAMLAAVDAGSYVDRSTTSLVEYLVDDWFPTYEQTVKPGTARLAMTNVRAYVEPYFGAKRLQSVKPQDLDRFYSELSKHGKRDGGGLNPKSIRNIHTMLHRALDRAVLLGLLQSNPASLASPPRLRHRELVVWTADELRQFLDALGDEPLAPVFVLIANTGLRRGEALGLRWRDVDWDLNRAEIAVALTADGIDEPKTRRSRRMVPLAPQVVDSLRVVWSEQAATALLVDGWNPDGLVFAGPTGEPMKLQTVSRTFDRIVDRTGLPKITLHGLRHTWATLALRTGIPAKIVSEMLGHSSVQITLDVYSHVLPGMTEDAVERVSSLIYGT